jgi:hypothetical protein
MRNRVKRTKRKRYLRKRALADRYDVDIRTVERMWHDGRIPPPDIWNGRFPMWSEETLELAERTSLTRTVRS